MKILNLKILLFLICLISIHGICAPHNNLDKELSICDCSDFPLLSNDDENKLIGRNNNTTLVTDDLISITDDLLDGIRDIEENNEISEDLMEEDHLQLLVDNHKQYTEVMKKELFILGRELKKLKSEGKNTINTMKAIGPTDRNFSILVNHSIKLKKNIISLRAQIELRMNYIRIFSNSKN